MKPLALLFGIFLLITSCEKSEEFVDTTYTCEKVYPANVLIKPIEKSLKGHFLFSWKNNENGWNYSIVPNLNSAMASENVSYYNSYTGEECLKSKLSKYPSGEKIYLQVSGSVTTVDDRKLELSSPTSEIISEIREYCEEIGLDLLVE